MSGNDFGRLRQGALSFVDGHRMEAAGPGAFRYASACTRPTVYASCYAALIYALTGDMTCLDGGEKDAWAAYLHGCQEADGLYGDPAITGEGWYAGDPLWCGRTHLTTHVLMALHALGHTARKEFAFLAPWKEPDALQEWLAARDWGVRVAYTGNEIMNIGLLLQYARDFHSDAAAGKAVDALLDWLDTHHLNAGTGVWGRGDSEDPVARSQAVQAAYHWWPLYFYDRRRIPLPHRVIDTLLATQNPAGGFGWGVHNPAEPNASSACEDIDSIDPLARLYGLEAYRHLDIQQALERASEAVLRNRTQEGGFVFIQGRDFEYGHPQLLGKKDQGAMFPTWFRLLSVAYIDRALNGFSAPWRFLDCPGMQFWHA